MTKDEFIRHCEEAVKSEESANQIYMKHLSAILQRSELGKEKLEKAREALSYLIGRNSAHKKILEGLLVRIRQEADNVY